MDEFEHIAELLAAPASWPDLSTDQIEEAVLGAATGIAVGRVDHTEFGAFYEHAMLALTPEHRVEIIVSIGRMCERLGRTAGQVPSDVFAPFIFHDDDYVVISTAALEMAQTMKHKGKASLTGPKRLISIAALLGDQKKAWILAGLSALGDSRVSPLLVDAWRTCSPQARSQWLKCLTAQRPTVALFQWFSALVEELAFDSFDVLAALTNIARAARGPRAPGGFSGGQVYDIERAFPSWSVPANESPVITTKLYQLNEVETFAPRLVPGPDPIPWTDWLS